MLGASPRDSLSAVASKGGARVGPKAAPPGPAPALTRLPEVGLGGRRKRRPERHDEVLLAAVGLFHAKGYRATSVEEIAAAVGVSTTAVYRHFRNKQEILDTAALWANSQLLGRLLAMPAESVSPRVRLEHVIDGLIDATLSTPHFIGLFVNELRSVSPSVRAECRAGRERYVTHWREALMGARPEISAAEADVRVDLVLTLITGMPDCHRIEQVDARTLAKEMSLAAFGIGGAKAARTGR